jgi:hypothetical protein
MNSLTMLKLSLIISFCLLSSKIVKPENLPNDFKVVATAGGLMPGEIVSALYIQPNGTTSFSRYLSNDPDSDPIELQQFTLTSGQLGQIWQAIQDNGFFSLEKEYKNLSICDRTYASLTVTANSTTHTVWTQNIAVSAFDNIINKINSITLPQYKLSYDISKPPVTEQIDVCDQFGFKSTYYYSKPSKKNPQSIVQIKPKSTKENTTYAHPGTFVAYELSLQEAVKLGYVNLTSKGDYWGDAISINANNSPSYASDKVKVKIFIEFYGPGATADNAQKVKNAIENKWSNKTTSDGKQFIVEVETRVSNSETPPGTAGYHQIKLDPAVTTSSVTGLKTDFNLNTGVGSGTWGTTGSQLDEIYAHEAGHLMGLDDRYSDYRKQADGNWECLNDNQTYTSAALADLLCSQYGMSKADLQTWLDNPKNNRITPPQSNHENDIMADLKKGILQADIDQIARRAGLAVHIRPGDMLINKDGESQNIAITRSEYLFVPAGGTKTLEGLYGACIDANNGIPSLNSEFDIVPPLETWINIEASKYLQRFLTYIDTNDLFCQSEFIPQDCIWRITDNIMESYIDTFLQKAGIRIGERILDFPRMKNPYSDLSGSHFIIPLQLYTISTQISPGLMIYQPQNITINAKVLAPQLENINSGFTWSLEKPPGSSASLSAITGNTVNITPDIRGVYKLNIDADFTDYLNQDVILSTSQIIIFADTRTETFESGNLHSSSLFDWHTPDSGKWDITDVIAHTGAYSICSGITEDNKTSEISINIETTENDSIFFIYKVSSEESDYLRFYNDELLISEWSGEVDWNVARFPVSKGNHKLKWTYEKDKYYKEGADKSWIDNIFFPNSMIGTTHIEKSRSLNEYKVIVYPDPVEQFLTLRYYVEYNQEIIVRLYDMNGKLIRLLNDENKETGIQTETYNLAGISTGMYIIKLQNKENVKSSNVFFIKE